MILAESIHQLREHIAIARKKELSIGLVPTMGYLHEGHGSLIEKAKQECDYVVLSIFVNPLQFGPNEDFDRYPRDLEHDLRFASTCGADLVFHPSVQEMYPTYPSQTKVIVTGITDVLCGATRKGHFDGVATVVAKLFHLIGPDKAYFGLKDAQQVAVIMQMVRDLNFPVEIVPCPTVREEDGLAKSSRNVYLSSEERKQAPVLYESLSAAKTAILKGETDARRIIGLIKEKIKEKPLANIEYVEIYTFPGLQAIEILRDETIIIALAVKFGKTRLIDNIIIPCRS